MLFGGNHVAARFAFNDGVDVATAVTSLYAAHHGAWGVRVHDVVGTIDAFDVADELAEEG